MGDCKKMNIQVKLEHYYRPSYDSKERFISYWYQINEIIKFKPESILEIGIGNKFVSNYLKDRGFKITTLDIDKRLNPDVVSSILSIPFSSESFDVVACYEVLEHLPYHNFNKALTEMHRVCINYTILSLPDVNRIYRLDIQIPRIGEIKKLIPLPRVKKLVPKFNGQHHWEIGLRDYSLEKILLEIQKIGFEIKKTYRIFEFPYHRFFILTKGKL